VDLPNSEIYFSIFSLTKTLYIFKFGEAHSEAIGTNRLVVGPPNLKRISRKNKIIIIFFSFLFFYILILFKHFKFGGPTTKLLELTAWLWARRTSKKFNKKIIIFLIF
jgi:hypothetical protein